MPKLYPCNICNKEFKTLQHLEQHKNKKKPCSPIDTSSGSSNSSTSSNSSLISFNDKIFEENNDIINFVKMYSNINNFIKDKNLIDTYKQQIVVLQEENKKLKYQINLINKISKKIGKFDNSINPSTNLRITPIKQTIVYDEEDFDNSISNETYIDANTVSTLTEDQSVDASMSAWYNNSFHSIT
jgi:hypothetical protein